MATQKYCCFKGRGEIALADRLAYIAKTAGLVPVGNASLFDIAISEKTDQVSDYTSPGGGIECVSREIERVDISMTLLCHNQRNLIRGLYATGAEDNVATAAVVGEAKVAYAGAVVPLEHLIDPTVAVVVKSFDDVTTYVLGTDYEITPAGSLKLLAGTTIAAPVVTGGVGQPNVKVSYTRKTQTVLQLFAKPSEAVFLHLDGYNTAGDAVVPQQFDLYNVKFQAAAKLEFIGDALSKLEMKGWALRDTSKPLGSLLNPFSQYGTLKI